MPSAVPRTSTFALNIQTAMYTLRLADEGLDAVRNNPALQYGLNTHRGSVTYPAIASEFDMKYTDPLQALEH
jgi:alanine dehydrogenase